MRSIRRRLLLSLLVGTGLLVLAAGLGATALVERHLRGEFDRALAGRAQLLVTLTWQQADELEIEFADEFMPEFEAAVAPEYFELWRGDGTVIERSRSLAGRDLPRSADLAPTPRFRDLRLPDGRPGRTVEVAFVPQVEDDPQSEDEESWPEEAADPRSPPGELASAVLVVGRGRGELEALLRLLHFTAVGIAVLLMAGIAGLAHWAVASGLEPLSQVGRQVEALDAGRLEGRVEVRPPVAELAPVVAQINGLLARLEAALERERRFSSDVAHELRTPVAELRNLAEVGERWPEDREAVRAFFADVRAIARQMQQTVATLLALARCEGGLEQAEREKVSLADLVAETWRPLAREAEARGLRLETAVPAEPVAADREKLGIILGNLLSNAVTYSPEGSRLSVAARVDGNDFELSVANPAPQLTAADLPHLFERFWRKDAARANGRHAGLGLALARSLANVQGLELTASLSPDQQLEVRLASALPSAKETR